MDYQVQSVLVPKQKFTLHQAVKWVENNNFVVLKVDSATNFWRFRQVNPKRGAEYRMKKLKNGVELVLMYF